MWIYLFVSRWKWGFMGACYALNVTYFTLLVVITVYSSLIERVRPAWFMPTWEELITD